MNGSLLINPKLISRPQLKQKRHVSYLLPPFLPFSLAPDFPPVTILSQGEGRFSPGWFPRRDPAHQGVSPMMRMVRLALLSVVVVSFTSLAQADEKMATLGKIERLDPAFDKLAP